MKKITNWRGATVLDCEADGLLYEATKMHVMSFILNGQDVKSFHGTEQIERIKSLFQYHIDNNIPIVIHNGIGYDIPLSEKLLAMDLSKLMIIDTLALSWYLNFDRKRHGLDFFFEDYGIAKPAIADWENLSYEEYRHRCIEDVKINKALWEDLKSRLEEMYTKSSEIVSEGLVGGSRVSEDEVIYLDGLKGLSADEWVDRILTFLMFKMDCIALQERTRWEVDVEYLKKSEEELTAKVEAATLELESVMPKIPVYSARKLPAKMYKNDGTLTVGGKKWNDLRKVLLSEDTDELGNPLCKVVEQGKIHELTGYKPPNIASHQQVKDFLFSKGWVPAANKSVRDEEAFNAWIASKPEEGSNRRAWTNWKNSKPEDRKVPQVYVEGEEGKELCPSVVELAEEVPEIKALENFSMVSHRLSMIKGFLRDLKDGKYLHASAGGFTNTLRMKHRELVNLPSANKPFAGAIRGGLVAGEGRVSLGSDLSGLEDRTKHHFMIPIDPEYVATMMEDDYDAHIYMAYSSGMITGQQYNDFKDGIKTPDVVDARRKGKTTNYAAVYGAGGAKVAETLKISVQEGKDLVEGYWKVNWSVKAIAEEQVVVECGRGYKWLINPVNGFLYNIRSEKDIFSTLAQGTGAFFFDMWVDNILTEMESRWGVKSLTGQFHDEIILVVKDNPKVINMMADLVRDSLEKVNEEFLLRRKLGCDVQFGYRYADIH